MRELTNAEVVDVSGAGAFSDAGKILGGGIGAIVDAATGKGPAGAEAGAALGSGIGAIVDASLQALGKLFWPF